MRERERFIESSGMSEKLSGGLVDNVLSLLLSLSYCLSVSQLPEISHPFRKKYSFTVSMNQIKCNE